MAQKEKVWYIDERSVQLAIMYLSVRDDLDITRADENPGPDIGLDLLVSIRKSGQRVGRVFGVNVHGVLSLAGKVRKVPGSDEVRVVSPTPFSLTDAPFPVCLFLFAMKTDEGYYKWMREPMVGTKGTARLVSDGTDTFRALSYPEIDRIVEAVDRWYDARSR